jgi:hypothetical protein
LKKAKIRKLKFNKKRHQILKLLSTNRIGVEVKDSNIEENYTLAVSFVDILQRLKINKYERFAVTSVLFEEDEVKYFDNGFKGIYATRKGVSAYYTEKYLNIDRNKNRSNITFWFGIITTILSLSIAILALSITPKKVDSKKSDIVPKDVELSINKNITT